MYLQLFRTANDAFDANSTTGVFAVMDRISHTIRLREALIKFGREFIVQHNVHNDLSEQLLNTLAKELACSDAYHDRSQWRKLLTRNDSNDDYAIFDCAELRRKLASGLQLTVTSSSSPSPPEDEAAGLLVSLQSNPNQEEVSRTALSDLATQSTQQPVQANEVDESTRILPTGSRERRNSSVPVQSRSHDVNRRMPSAAEDATRSSGERTKRGMYTYMHVYGCSCI